MDEPTPRRLIQICGGAARLRAKLKTPTPAPSTVRAWATRNSIPGERYLEVLALAAEAKSMTIDQLLEHERSPL